MVWTVIYSNETVREVLTDGNSYEEAFLAASGSKVCQDGEMTVYAIIKGHHKDTIRFRQEPSELERNLNTLCEDDVVQEKIVLRSIQ